MPFYHVGTTYNPSISHSPTLRHHPHNQGKKYPIFYARNDEVRGLVTKDSGRRETEESHSQKVVVMLGGEKFGVLAGVGPL